MLVSGKGSAVSLPCLQTFYLKALSNLSIAIMKLKIIFCSLLISTQSLYAQLYISQGALLKITGNELLTLQNTGIINHGSFLAGAGTVSFTGNNTSLISGSQQVVFNTLEISKTNGSSVVMQVPVNVVNSARFITGYLDLNGYSMDLGSSGSLMGEQENSHITGSNGGQVLFSTILNNPVNANPANLGAVISCGQNLGPVLIRRGHKSQMNNYGIGNSVLRYYDIIPAINTNLNATLRFNYFDGELNGLAENTLVFWSSSDNLHWTNQDFTLGNTNLNYLEKTGIPSFSRWTISGPNNPLPVTFTLFNFKCDGNKVILTWKTAQEQNSSHYHIERSTDAVSWFTIGQVPAAGNSSTERSYFFNDNGPVSNCYYRIAQYDLDGHTTYSSILMSACNMKDNFTVRPNPFTDKLIIDLTSEKKSKVIIKIFDSKGSLVKKQELSILSGINQLPVESRGLIAGTYTLSVEWCDGQAKKTIKIIKQ